MAQTKATEQMAGASGRLSDAVYALREHIAAHSSAEKQQEAPNKGLIIAIPAYNEARFIGSIVLQLRRNYSTVIVVDDGSDDDTAMLARDAGAFVFTHQTNRGKSASLNTIFQLARAVNAQGLLLIDGDGQHRASDAPIMLAPILAGEADMVVGSRYMGPRSETPAHRVAGQQALNALTTFSSGVRVSDSQSGLRAFSAHAIQMLAFSGQGFSVESELQFLVREHSLKVVEVPIVVYYREKAKRSPVSHGMQVINGILTLVARRRPLLLFGGCGAILTVGGATLGAYVAATYAATQQLAVGYALITVLSIVLGCIALLGGLILNALAEQLEDLRYNLQMLGQQLLPGPVSSVLTPRQQLHIPIKEEVETIENLVAVVPSQARTARASATAKPAA